MPKISSTSELREIISKLEYKQKEQWIELKGNINTAFESLKPINIIKSTYRDVVNTPDLMDNLIGTTIGLSTGFLTRKIIVRRSGNVVRKIAGRLAQMAVSGFISRNSGAIKSIGSGLLNRIFSKKAAKTLT